MFYSKTTLTARLTDAIDLLIDFATLGEYGLEPAGRAPEPCERRRQSRDVRGASRAEARVRTARPNATGPRLSAARGVIEEPAATYSPRRLPSKYHRR
jgi:hypothetical protein